MPVLGRFHCEHEGQVMTDCVTISFPSDLDPGSLTCAKLVTVYMKEGRTGQQGVVSGLSLPRHEEPSFRPRESLSQGISPSPDGTE